MNYSILHIGNIANIAYSSCKILNKFGHSGDLICHDEKHLMSQPEWADLDLDPNDFPNENDFFDNLSNENAYKYPSWYKRSNILGKNETYIRNILSNCPVFIKSFLKRFYTFFQNCFFSIYAKSKKDTNQLVNLKGMISQAYDSSAQWGLTKTDFYSYLPHAKWLYNQTGSYDICFAYAAAPIYCLIGSPKPYVAIEIGTLRDLPPINVLGKLLALSYQKADYVLVTNPDTSSLLKELGVKNYRFCPHPVDEDIYKPLIGQEIQDIRNELIGKDKVDLLVIAPARQNWQIKGNQKYLEAVKRLKEDSIIVKLIVPLWGQDIKKSQDYAEKLGISLQIKWIKPIPEQRLIKYFSAVDAVIDQFELGVFGLVTAKALACAVPILTSYDPEVHSWCFKSHPPILRCCGSDDISYNLKKLLNYPYRNNLKIQSREWFLKYHSSSVVNKIMTEVTETVLKGASI